MLTPSAEWPRGPAPRMGGAVWTKAAPDPASVLLTGEPLVAAKLDHAGGEQRVRGGHGGEPLVAAKLDHAGCEQRVRGGHGGEPLVAAKLDHAGCEQRVRGGHAGAVRR